MSTAVVIGAGIAGAALAQRLAGTHRLAIIDTSGDRAAAAAELARRSGASAADVQSFDTDVADIDAVESLVRQMRAHDDVTLVAHLVGGWRGSPGLDAEALGAYAALATPLLTTVQVTSVAFRDALAASGGRYVMVTSTAKPTAGNAAYVTAKTAAQTWLRAMAHSLRDTDAAVCVLAVKALVSDTMRRENPDQAYSGFTDVGVLADEILACTSLVPQATNPGWIFRDLTEGGVA